MFTQDYKEAERSKKQTPFCFLVHTGSYVIQFQTILTVLKLCKTLLLTLVFIQIKEGKRFVCKSPRSTTHNVS